MYITLNFIKLVGCYRNYSQLFYSTTIIGCEWRSIPWPAAAKWSRSMLRNKVSKIIPLSYWTTVRVLPSRKIEIYIFLFIVFNVENFCSDQTPAFFNNELFRIFVSYVESLWLSSSIYPIISMPPWSIPCDRTKILRSSTNSLRL